MNKAPAEKILILRFSSFGDITQALSIPAALKKSFPQAEIHWATREDFAILIKNHPQITQIWTIKKGSGLKELLNLGRLLRRANFSHVYDAHNSLRSRVISWQLRPRNLVRKPSYRLKRFLLFRFRVNLFDQPFSGQRELLAPLKTWGVSMDLPPTPQLFLESSDQKKPSEHLSDWIPPGKEFVALAASAAHPLKRWPVEHWKELIKKSPERNFVLLGGPEDRFIEDIAQVAPDRCLNLAGKLSLMESAAVVARASALVANDTGLLHVGEQLGVPCVALMGPAPFGFPSRRSTTILEENLKCRPCSKHGQGPCINPEFQKCMRDITPDRVIEALRSPTLGKEPL